MIRHLLLSSAALLLAATLNAQSVAINTDGTTANASSLLEVKSTTKGMLIPRMTKSEKSLIGSPATGLLIFQNSPDSIGFHFYNGSAWVWLGDASNTDSLSWKTTGNNNLRSSNFIGTLNDSALRFRIRNTASGIIDSISQNTALGFKTLYGNNGSGNTALGFRSLASNSAGNQNVAIGDSALSTNQITPGLVAVGYNALAKSKSGDYSTALGYQALAVDTTGQFNTAVGAFALNSSARGLANTAVGAAALSSVTTGGFNTAVGQAALYLHVKNGNNTAIGSNALQNDTTGFNNTAVGLSSMLNNTNGFDNSALGRESLKSHTNNNNNTAIGSLALSNDLTGSENTGIGYSALTTNTSGQFNTSLGANANVAANNLSNATAIGYRAMVGQSNSMVLGSISGVNSAVADTKVGIGTTTPNTSFHVDGSVSIGLSMGIAGGPGGSPVSLVNSKYYVGLSPADNTNNNYQLPSPVAYPGRVYIIRNNSAFFNAVLSTAAGSLYPGSSDVGIATYTLNTMTSVKTVMVISDGTNWTIMKQD